MSRKIDFDAIAGTYDQRYDVRMLVGVASKLRDLADEVRAACILEAGCGTGRWLSEFIETVEEVHGLDASSEMLKEARRRDARFVLEHGKAGSLPYPDNKFDLVFCVNAIHHFDQKKEFISDAKRTLRPGGSLAIIGMDPHVVDRDSWYIYQHFAGTYEADCERHPPGDTIMEWMSAAGFREVERCLAEKVENLLKGRQVFENHFLKKYSTSQLASLTDEEYQAGRTSIENAVARAEAEGGDAEFPVNVSLWMVTGEA